MAEDDVPATSTPEVAPAEAPAVETPTTPPRPTYHVSIWDPDGPGYVCLLCPPGTPHFTLEAIKEHMPTVHECDAVPTETIPMLLNLRAESDARSAATAVSPE